MIILDTNVISEQMSPRPSDAVRLWLNRQSELDLFLSSITISELVFGASLVREQSRRERLLQVIDRIRLEFSGRILPFDDDAAMRYGQLAAARRQAGQPIETKDAMIAAICLHHGATLATRNVRDFSGLDLTVVNPFDAD